MTELSELPQAESFNPSIAELIALMLTSAGHIALKLYTSGRPLSPSETEAFTHPQTIYSIVAAIGWAVYIAWRAWRTPGMARAWGLRRDTFWPALVPTLAFAIPATGVLLAYAAAMDRLPLPRTFWLTFALYPLWGIPQQFALQALVTRNLTGLMKNEWAIALTAAALFSLAHAPNLWLMALVFPVGGVFSMIWQRRPNVWALGIVHGPLGALAYYCVLGQDPGAAILRLFSS